MKQSFFRSNRQHLIDALNGGVVVLSAYAELQRQSDMAHAFTQEANFWWLTGIEAADWWVIIDGARGKTWLAAPTVSQSHAIFDGSLSWDAARAISGAEAVISHDEADSLLRELSRKHSLVYTIGDDPYAKYYDFTPNPGPKEMSKRLERIFSDVVDCRKELAGLRARKQPVEISAIKKAISLTIDAFEDVKQKLPELRYEYEVEAEFSYHFRKHGSSGHAYEPIVAAGANACTLHYIDNNTRLKKRELLLLDIGASWQGYPADITRTYALGEPTKRQAEVHAAVSTAQKAIINLLKPELGLEEYQQQVDRIMIEALLSLGLMTDADDQVHYEQYFPHAVSHGLGVDVHDSLGSTRYFQPGMVLTVEPGIYIPEEGIGVRIEDDILITETGHTNLSARLSTGL